MAITWECARCGSARSLSRAECCGGRHVRQYWVDVCRTINGRKHRHREVIGPSLKAARARERQVLTMLTEREYLPQPSSLTLKDLVRWYLGLPDVVGKPSARRNEQCLNHCIELLDKTRHVETLTVGEGQTYQARRQEQGAAPGTINRECAVLKAALNKAAAHGRIKGNPLEGLRPVPGANARKRVATDDEIQRILGAVSPHLDPIVRITHRLGLRQGEVLGLRWAEIDFENKFIRLPAHRTKTNTARVIPVPDDLMQMLDGLRADAINEFVFNYEGRPVQCIDRAWGNALRRANVQNLWFHDLRRTAITNMRRAGIDLITIMAISGHKTTAVFAGYNAVDENDLARVWERRAS